MIKDITDEQVAKFPEYVEKYIRIGLSTDRMDKDAAVAAVKLAYEKAEVEMP